MRYSDDTINKMARDALYLEKTKKYEDALNIYMELASQENEFAINRIPVLKHKIEQTKLKNVNYFLKLVSLSTVTLTAVVIATNFMGSILIKPVSLSNATEQVKEAMFNELNIEIEFKTIKSMPKRVLNSELEILVEQNISTKKLKDRTIESLNLYKGELPHKNGELDINIKALKSGKKLGFIEYKKNEPDKVTINLLEK